MILRSGITILSKHIITATGVVVDIPLWARPGRWAASVGNSEALFAPSPIILTEGTGVIKGQDVIATSGVDVRASCSAGCVTIISEHHALVAPAPLVLATDGIAVER
jgi:hypothetical protein